MSADILTADGGSITLAAPAPGTFADGATSYEQTSWVALAGQNEFVVASLGLDDSGNGRSAVLSAYSLNGTLLFQRLMDNPSLHEGLGSMNIEGAPSVAAVGSDGEFAFNWNSYSVPNGQPTANPMHDGQGVLAFYQADGDGIMAWGVQGLPPELFAASFGLHVESATTNPDTVHFNDYNPDFTPIGQTTTAPGLSMPAYADISLGGGEFTIRDNLAQLSGDAAVTVPGEPAHAITQITAASLADGHSAAVAWVDSGTDYVSIYDSVTNSFTPSLTLDWSGASDVHVVALDDGGFAVSWMKDGAYYGELFDGAGEHGAKMSLTGQFAAVNSQGELYTVGTDSSGNEVVQTYSVSASDGASTGGGGTGGSTGGGTTGGGDTGGSGGSTGGSGGTSGAVDTLSVHGAAVALPTPSTNSVQPYGYDYKAVGYAVAPGSGEVVVVYQGTQMNSTPDVVAVGYTLQGGTIFEDSFTGGPASATGNEYAFAGASSPRLAAMADGNLAIAYQTFETDGQAIEFNVITSSGAILSTSHDTSQGFSNPFILDVSTLRGSALVRWDSRTAAETQIVYNGGDAGYPTSTGDMHLSPISFAMGASGTWAALNDTQFQYVDGSPYNHFASLPNEPAETLTSSGLAILTGGLTAAAWVDSGTEHVSLFDPRTNSFSAPVTADWGGVSDTHVVALRDGGFVVSWMKDGAYLGEVFSASGAGGGVMSLDGDVAGIDGNGDLYTIGLNSSGQYEVQTYTVSSPGGQAPAVSTSDANYTAPDGVTTITLTGHDQTIHGNNGGDTIFSDNTHNVLYGGTGNDTFHIGRAGDTITGGGGSDVFAYADVPWGGSRITDFHSGDVIDLTGLVASQHDPGSDPFADGYLKYDTDASGNARIWANYNQAGNDGWWLVVTLDGVSTSSLHYSQGLIT